MTARNLFGSLSASQKSGSLLLVIDYWNTLEIFWLHANDTVYEYHSPCPYFYENKLLRICLLFREKLWHNINVVVQSMFHEIDWHLFWFWTPGRELV